MSEDVSGFKEKISELEAELAMKSAELLRYRAHMMELNQRIETLVSQVSSELNIANRIQKMLSPVDLPNIQGFEFSSKFVFGTKLGGDYFDIFEHDDKLKFGILLVSCSGYSMSALLMSVLLKISSRIQSKQALPPHKMMESLAQELRPQLQDKDLANIFYGVIDRRSFELSYCSMGNTCAFLQASGKSALQVLKAQTSALSKNGDLPTSTVVVDLNPKDRFLLVTEGVIEAKDSNGRSFGETGVVDAIQSAARQGVHELRNEVLYTVERFSGRSEPVRDQTVLVTEVKEKVIKLARN